MRIYHPFEDEDYLDVLLKNGRSVLLLSEVSEFLKG